MKHLPPILLSVAFSGVASAVLTGCAGLPARPAQAITRPVYLPTAAVIGPGYRYYPDYEVFHSVSRGHFVYQDGEKWVAHAEPPGVSRKMLFASPSMAAGFQSGTVDDHSSVVRFYPQPRTSITGGLRIP